MDIQKEQAHFDRLRWLENNRQRQIKLANETFGRDSQRAKEEISKINKQTNEKIKRAKFWHEWGENIISALAILALITIIVFCVAKGPAKH